MGSFDLGKLSVMGGVRVEETRSMRRRAAMLTAAEQARRAAFVGR